MGKVSHSLKSFEIQIEQNTKKGGKNNRKNGVFRKRGRYRTRPIWGQNEPNGAGENLLKI